MPRAGRSGLLGLAVALALADTSVVTLALPDIVSRFGVSITDVAWVLISYNLVLAAGAVPAARMVRGRSRLLCVAGLVVFSAASLGCATPGRLAAAPGRVGGPRMTRQPRRRRPYGPIDGAAGFCLASAASSWGLPGPW